MKKPFVVLLIALAATVAPIDGCTCGQGNAQQPHPWLVSVKVGDANGYYTSCGGSLINDRYILTAGECFIGEKPEPSRVVAMLGAKTNSERWHAGKGQQKLEIESIKLHEKFDAKVIGRSGVDNNVALLKLREPVKFSGSLSPICLPNFEKYSNLSVLGWGHKSPSPSKGLQEIQVNHVPYVTRVNGMDESSCVKKLPSWFVPEKQICAGTNVGICQEEGSPLFTQENGHAYQAGVVIFQIGRCTLGDETPDISERVSSHLKWIEENTKDAAWCSAPNVPEFTKKQLAESNGDDDVQDEEEPPQPEPRPPSTGPECACGVEKLNTRILNGQEARKGRYPWMVSLLVRNPDRFLYHSCGGSLINDQYVLTAAHCIKERAVASDMIVMLGAHTNSERWKEEGTSEKLEVESYLLHEKYTGPSTAYLNDIALLKLKKPADIAKWTPICLPNFYGEHSNLFLAGWGLQNSAGQKVDAKVLHEVDMDEVNNATCKEKYWHELHVPELRICSGTVGGECQGDSGGSLSTRRNGHVYAVGITSMNQVDCAVNEQRVPGLYERITSHLDWIKRHTSGANWCSAPDTPEFTRN